MPKQDSGYHCQVQNTDTTRKTTLKQNVICTCGIFFSISFLKMFNKIHSEIQKIVFPNVFNFHLSGFSLIHVSTLWFQQIWLNDNNIKRTINGKNVKRCNSNPVYQSCVCATCKHTDVKKKMFHYPDVNSEITFKFAMFGLYCANQPSVSEYMTVHTV